MTPDEILGQTLDMEPDEIERHLAGLEPDHPEAVAEARELIALAKDPAVGDFILLMGTPPARMPAPAPEPASDLPGINGFVVQGVIGHGGMGIVYRVTDLGLGTDFALKTLRPGLPYGNALSRVEDEARLVARLKHPAVVPALQIGSFHDARGERRAWFKMPLIEGIDIVSWSRGRSLIEVTRKISELVEAMSEMRLQHGDLKPANLLVDSSDQLRILDFDVAVALRRADSEGARLVSAGTPIYSSPENLDPALESSDRGDIYSIGVLLFECVTGMPPVDPCATNRFDLLEGLRHADRHPFGEGHVRRSAADRRRIREGLGAIVVRATQRDPQRRYETCKELLRDLRRWLSGRPVAAQPCPPRVRAWLATRRNRVKVSVSAVILLAVGFGLVMWAVSMREQQLRAAQRIAQLESLRDDSVLEQLEVATEHLLPFPGQEEEIELWLREAARRSERLEIHEARIVALVAGSRVGAQHEVPWAGTVFGASDGLARLMEFTGLWRQRGSFAVFDDEAQQWEHDALAQLTYRLRRLDEILVPLMQRRLEAARAASRACMAAAFRWDDVANHASQRYPGLVLGPQSGLVPLGPDPESDLLEFAHTLTGNVPERDGDGVLQVDGDSCVVLVLLPGGEVEFGDRSFHLDPFFLSKYELTQAQWERWTGTSCSELDPVTAATVGVTPGHPAESMSWLQASAALHTMGLVVPTEAQWRCGLYAEQPGWWGERDARDEKLGNFGLGALVDPSDGWSLHAPVWEVPANPWGLHGMLGNVSEWARDVFRKLGTDVSQLTRSEGHVFDTETKTRTLLGGNFVESIEHCVRNRLALGYDAGYQNWLGVRPARRIE